MGHALLDYTISTDPNPLQVGKEATLTVIGGLAQTYSDKAASNYVDVKSIALLRQIPN